MSHPASRLARRATHLLALGSLAFSAACASRPPAMPFLPPSRPAQLSLAGIPWGIAQDSASTLMETRGYNFNSVDQDGDLVFDGVLMRTPTRVYGYMADGRLVKFRMIMMTADEAALDMYRTVRTEMVKRYGAPQETVEEYEAPYAKATAQEAVSKGKAVIRTHWLVGTGTKQQHVAVAVNDNLTVVVDYNGPSWERESLRRRRGEAASR